MAITTLDGGNTVLPDSAAGRVFWVAFAFRRQDQSQVDTWLPWLAEMMAADTTSRFFEIPLMGPGIPGFLRGVIRAGMRLSVPADKHASLAPWYEDLEPVALHLGLDDRTRAHIFLVGPDGAIEARAEGEATGETAQAMLDLARALTHTEVDDADP